MALVETWLPAPAEAPERSITGALAGWISERLVAFVACTGMLLAVGYVHAVNFAGWPTLANDDEGTYMARAWAVQTGRGAHHSLANYTYWYDHAPLGWMQLVPFTWAMGVYRAGTTADIDGRRIMVVYALISTVLVYVIARRLSASRPAALMAMALFGFSPVALDYTRQIFLDSIGMPWALGALALALSPRRNLWAYAASGACFAAACLSKETYLLYGPALLYALWQRVEPPARRMCLVAFCSVALGLLALWPLYAVLKGELLPGKGHVSLIGAIEWQLTQRKGSGSLLSKHSNTRADLLGWYHDDPWLVGGGLVAMIPAAFFRRFRPVVAGLFVALLYAVHGGYLPAMYVEGFCPLMALLIACSGDALVRVDLFDRILARAGALVRSGAARARTLSSPSTLAWRVLVLGALAALAAQVAPDWASADSDAMTYQVNNGLFQAESYVETHVPKSATILVDENVWIDLVDDGYAPSRVVAFWELNTDPDVERLYPRGWKQMDYVVVSDTIRVNILGGGSLGPVIAAIGHGTAVRTFGTGTNFVTIFHVHPNAPANHTWWLPGYGSLIPPTSGPLKGEQL